MKQLICAFFLIYISSAHSAPYWQAVGQGSEVPQNVITGTIEADGTKRPICRVVKAQATQVGKLMVEKGKISCRYAINQRKNKIFASLFRDTFLHASDEATIEVLLFETQNDHSWISASDFVKNMNEATPAGSADPNDDSAICRGKNWTLRAFSGFIDRGLHTGKLFAQDEDIYCLYEFGDRGFESPDLYQRIHKVMDWEKSNFDILIEQ